jgi:hypothetical protein
MKTLFAALMFIVSTVSFASIRDSKYDVRHVNVIEAAILKNCGNIGDLAQISSLEEVIQIDQGLYDVRYETVITGTKNHQIHVQSYYMDVYDHVAREWGVYSVEAIKCVME